MCLHTLYLYSWNSPSHTLVRGDFVEASPQHFCNPTSPWWNLRACLWGIFLISNWCRRSQFNVGSATPWQVALSHRQKLPEHEQEGQSQENNQESSFLGLCFNSCLQIHPLSFFLDFLLHASVDVIHPFFPLIIIDSDITATNVARTLFQQIREIF